jgi:hypothetical protein
MLHAGIEIHLFTPNLSSIPVRLTLCGHRDQG